MFDPSSIVVGLEIGTSKICAVAGDVSADGSFRILGIGQSESRGVRKGEIVNPSEVSDLLRQALRQAEEMADVEIRGVWLGVTGGHVHSQINRGFHSIASDDRRIGPEDVEDALRIANAINLPVHAHEIHVIQQQFMVDGVLSDNPVGMYGQRLDADILVICGAYHRLQSSIGVVRELQLDVEDVAFNGLASSLAVLRQEQKELGTLVVDIGGGTTEYTVTRDGIVRHAGVLAVGGDHLSQDLAIGLKTPLGQAEKLKIEYGQGLDQVTPPDGDVRCASDNGLPGKTFSLTHIHRILSARLDETFQIVGQKIAEASLLEEIRGGTFLCGGTARIPGITGIAARYLPSPIRLAEIQCASGMASSVNQCEFATAIGLAKFGSFQVLETIRARRTKRWPPFSSLFGR